MADSVDDPDDAEKSDDLNECDKSDDSDDSLMPFRASCPSSKKWSWRRFPQPGQWLKSRQLLLTAYSKMTIFQPLAARSLERPSDRT